MNKILCNAKSKIRVMCLLLAVLMALTMTNLSVLNVQAATVAVSIGTAAELTSFVTACNNGTYSSANLPVVTQTADIDLSGVSWTSINSFYGTYNGNGHTIKNMKTGIGGEGNATPFVRDNYGTIKNIVFTNASVFNQDGYGSAVVAGNNSSGGIVENCSVINSTIQIGNYEGLASVVGKNYEGATVRNCVALNNTFRRRYGAGSKDAGGIVQINQGTVENCIAYGCNTYTNCDTFGGIVATGTAPTTSFYYSTQTMNSTVDGVAKTTDEFSSGAVAWLLNGESSTNTVWYQNIETDNDLYPTLDSTHKVVYKGTSKICPDSQTVVERYNNTSSDLIIEYPNHNYVNDVCSGCGKINVAEPEKNTEGTYLISSYGNLVWFQQYVDAGNYSINAELTADIVANKNVLNTDGTLNGTPANQWTPILKDAGSYINSFAGTFDGKGHTISGLYINDPRGDNTGLFGTSNGTIKNINIVDSYIKGDYHATTFVGYGYMDSVISNCSSNATVEGTMYNGGIAGYTTGKIENCYFAGKLTSTDDTANAVASDYYNRGTLINCYYIDTCGLTSTRATAKTAEQFASGEVCYLLNGSSAESPVWYQNLDNGQTSDSYPILDSSHGTVCYGYESCISSMTYSNSIRSTTPNHSYTNGKCNVCGYECPHTSYTNGKCDVCGYECPHTSCTNDKCNLCGLYKMTVPEIDGDYYLITDRYNYYWFVNEVNSGRTALNAILMADIDFGGLELEPIVPSATFSYNASTVDETTDKSFSGTFDGNGHTLSNFVIKKDETQLTSGLFGAVSGTVKHLGVENASFDNNGEYDGRFGGICGLLVTGGTIENCYIINSNINTVSKIAGAVCGANYGGTVINCYEMNNTVTGNSRIGNLIGDNKNDSGALVGTAKNCYSDTKVVGTNGGNTESCAVKTAAQFASDVCYYLNNGVTDGTQIWYQNIDNGETPDSSPKFTGGTVYINGSNTDGILLYINNVQVTEDNKDNVLDDNATVKFDSTTGTLTLNGANIIAGTQVTGIKSIGHLTIEVIGDNSVTGGTGFGSAGWAGGNTGDPAISVTGTLALKGDGSLTATGGNGGAASGTGGGGADAIKTTEGLIIESGSLIASGGKAYVGAKYTGTDGKGINGSLTLKGGSVVAKGSTALTTAPAIEGLYKWRTTENGEYTGSKKQEYTYAESAYTELVSIKAITGDVDSNGTVDKADAAYILKYAGGIITQEQVPNFGVADVNSDGNVDMLDAIAILQASSNVTA